MVRVELVVLVALACVPQVRAGSVSPVEKVITLLEELKGEVEEEGKEEAKTYDTFACFCKDTTKEKSDAIKETHGAIEEFAATMQEKSEGGKAKAQEILELDQAIAKADKEIQTITSMREGEKTRYEGSSADLGKGIGELEHAISDAKGGKFSLAKMGARVKKSLLVADALNLTPKHSKAVSALIQSLDDPEDGEDYDFHAGDLISTFEALDKQFLSKKAEVDSIEAQNKKDFNQLLKSKTEEKTSLEENKETAEEEKATLDGELATASDSIIENEGVMKDDEAYLKDLTERCEMKASEWDQRSQMRSDEVTALTKALEIIQAKVKDNSAVNERAFIQHDDDYTGPVSTPKKDVEDARNDADEEFLQVASLQISSPRQKLRGITSKAVASVDNSDSARRQRAITALVATGKKLKSTTLSSLAMKLAVDPFPKVKKLIQDLIQKLVAEAADEATKKGWCDTEMGKATHTRDDDMNKIMSINSDLATFEANKQALEEAITALTTEIAELNDSLAKQTKERADDKAENMDTLDKAKEGLAAVKDAYDTLKSFYKGAAKGQKYYEKTAVLLQRQPEGEAKGNYHGNQDKGGGILAMLDVIISDFERTIKTTKSAEKKSQREFVRFERTTKASIASKETSKSQNEFGLKETERSIVESMDDLDKHQKMLDDVLMEIEDLKPACTDTGMSFEDRVQKRKDEIDALKQAMCELDSGKVEEECK